jgi:hypothetical protein
VSFAWGIGMAIHPTYGFLYREEINGVYIDGESNAVLALLRELAAFGRTWLDRLDLPGKFLYLAVRFQYVPPPYQAMLLFLAKEPRNNNLVNLFSCEEL